MSLNQRLKGLSLKVGPLGENDRLLTILSEENGISRFAIPGARKPKSSMHFTAHLHCISSLHVFIAYPHCIPSWHIFIEYLHCISSLQIFIAYLR